MKIFKLICCYIYIYKSSTYSSSSSFISSIDTIAFIFILFIHISAALIYSFHIVKLPCKSFLFPLFMTMSTAKKQLPIPLFVGCGILRFFVLRLQLFVVHKYCKYHRTHNAFLSLSSGKLLWFHTLVAWIVGISRIETLLLSNCHLFLCFVGCFILYIGWQYRRLFSNR